MSAATVIALVVAVGEGRSPATKAMVLAAEETLGAGTSIRVFEAAPPSDDAALDVEAEIGARAVVTLVWQDAAHLQAHTRLHVARKDRWTDREIEFAPGDTAAERGRALGFAIASMLPEVGGVGRPVRLAAVEVTAPPPTGPAPRFAVGLSGMGATGLGGGYGGTIEGTARAGEVTLRLAVSGRSSRIEGLSGTDLFGAAAAGLGWWPLVPVPGRRLGVGLRADALLLRHQVTQEGDGPNAVKTKLMPGADLVAELAVLLGAGLELGIAAGIEVAFGATEVFAGTEGVPTYQQFMPPVRGVAQAGLRLRF